jgi:hypothetical protein
MEERPGSFEPLARRVIDDPSARYGRSVQFIPQEIAHAELRLRDPNGEQFPFDQPVDHYEGSVGFEVPSALIVATAQVDADGALPAR